MKTDTSPFDELAAEYDAWFDKEGSHIFFNEVKAFQGVLPDLPKPWLEIGVGSGRFAQALGIETGGLFMMDYLYLLLWVFMQ